MSAQTFILIFLLGLIPLGSLAFFLGWRKARRWRDQGRKFHSRVDYYGWYALLQLGLPPVLLSAFALLLELFGLVTIPPLLLLAAALTIAVIGLGVGLRRIQPHFRARASVERVIKVVLVAASLVSILTTFGIVISIIFESLHFFEQVSVWGFLTGTTWSPDAAFLEGAGRGQEAASRASFGSVPIFAGTFMVTAIAMAVAVPIGLLSAIYMSEYASPHIRSAAKPILEILAGIPTVVYGFFAAITVSPLVVDLAHFLGLEADYTNALAPGLVMGIMIIPFVSSLSDDVISAVPNNLREGSYALGMTTSETVKQVLLPAALPGIVSAFLLAISRALGETMIVVMAAGLRPNLTWNPLEGMTTVTVRIVAALTGDQAFDSLETLSAFALGLALFIVTLTLNVVATLVIIKFRQRYE